MKRLRLWLSALLLAYVAAAAAIALIGLRDYGTVADVIVVPGNTVYADGTLSNRLRARLDVAIELFKDGRAPTIFVSGGIGNEGRDEALAMANYLIAQGVPSVAIEQDPLGIDTGATAANAAKYLHARKLETALVATQYFHIARTKLALERNGVTVVGTSHARYAELRDVYSLAREVMGYVVYFVNS